MVKTATDPPDKPRNQIKEKFKKIRQYPFRTYNFFLGVNVKNSLGVKPYAWSSKNFQIRFHTFTTGTNCTLYVLKGYIYLLNELTIYLQKITGAEFGLVKIKTDLTDKMTGNFERVSEFAKCNGNYKIFLFFHINLLYKSR